jgi:hypothetical protein
MMNISLRGLVRYGGVAAAAIFMLWSMPDQRAEALSLINPGSAPAARISSDDLTIEVRGGGHGGGGHGGGHGGGGFHGGGHGGGFHGGHVFHGGGFRHGGFAFRHHHFHRRFFYAGYGPSYYYYPHRRCRIIWSYYGPHRICHFRHWRHRWHHRGYW